MEDGIRLESYVSTYLTHKRDSGSDRLNCSAECEAMTHTESVPMKSNLGSKVTLISLQNTENPMHLWCVCVCINYTSV